VDGAVDMSCMCIRLQATHVHITTHSNAQFPLFATPALVLEPCAGSVHGPRKPWRGVVFFKNGG
jgi:hypothetical protein